jgi:hypothetical protein
MPVQQRREGCVESRRLAEKAPPHEHVFQGWTGQVLIVSSLGISLAELILLGALFALADATRADEIVRPSRVDAALLRHPRQHLAIGQSGQHGA